MITFNVPSEQPLTNLEDAIEVFVALNINGDQDIEGVYPNFERVIQYIEDGRDISVKKIHDCLWEITNGIETYEIQKTYLRM